MKSSVPLYVGVIVIAIVVVIAGILLWNNTQQQGSIPAKPPSGPIVLPPSQQGRTIPGGRANGSL